MVMINRKARAIFEKYAGNKFQMVRDYEYEAYKKYCIPEGVELEWANEAIQRLATRTGGNSEIEKQHCWHRIEEFTINCKCVNGIGVLLDIARVELTGTDSFSKILIAEKLYSVAKSLDMQQEEKQKMLDCAIELINNVISRPIVLSDEYQGTYLSSYLSDSKILERAKRDLVQFKQ